MIRNDPSHVLLLIVGQAAAISGQNVLDLRFDFRLGLRRELRRGGQIPVAKRLWVALFDSASFSLDSVRHDKPHIHECDYHPN
jgi:hypothetical protein